MRNLLCAGKFGDAFFVSFKRKTLWRGGGGVIWKFSRVTPSPQYVERFWIKIFQRERKQISTDMVAFLCVMVVLRDEGLLTAINFDDFLDSETLFYQSTFVFAMRTSEDLKPLIVILVILWLRRILVNKGVLPVFALPVLFCCTSKKQKVVKVRIVLMSCSWWKDPTSK